MSLLPLVLVAAILAADAGYGVSLGTLSQDPILVAVTAIGPTIVILLVAWWTCRRTARHVGQGHAERMAGAAALVRLARALVLINAIFAVLALEWLGTIRGLTGDLVFVDELIVMLPALGALYLLGVAWYPIEVSIAATTGNPVPLASRWGFAWSQFSIGVLLILLPALLIVAFIEAIEAIDTSWISDAWRQVLFLVVVAAVFLGMPLVVRGLLAVRPMAPGPLRDSLLDVCDVHAVRVREILRWRTGGVMLNAAVVGLVGRLRYVLMTDTLVRMLPERYIEAVMAHEVGHVRRRHMPWLFLSIVSLVLLAEVALVPIPVLPRGDSLLQLGVLLVVLWVGFGWISRRFEQQADAFAVQHLSRSDAETELVTVEAVTTMIGTLQAIATLNGDRIRRHSWRHGSIAWRCGNLARLAGQPRHRLPIDTVVARIKLATLVVGPASLAVLFFLHA
ncbi:MAG: M48 family metalloprotease [Phycisphaerales bacterium]|nr:M48 family metalloprotease [Phycisphaerales bacterium]